MSQPRFCPDCVSEMQPETRKLGGVSKFHVCLDCGHREQDNEAPESLIINTSKNEKRRDYEDCSRVIIDELLEQGGISE